MQAAADAAERRAQDDIGCACGLRSGTDFSNEGIVGIEHGDQDVVVSSQSLMVGPSSNRAGQRHGQQSTWRGRPDSIPSGLGTGETFREKIRKTQEKESEEYRLGGDAMEDVVDLTIDSDSESQEVL